MTDATATEVRADPTRLVDRLTTLQNDPSLSSAAQALIGEAIDRIDAATEALDAADVVASRYCGNCRTQKQPTPLSVQKYRVARAKVPPVN